MEQITLDYRNWKSGISSADGKEDGGYSPLYGGHNIQEKADDLLYPQPNYSTGAFTGETIADEPIIFIKNTIYGSTTPRTIGMLVDANASGSSQGVISIETLSTIDNEANVTGTDMTLGHKGVESGVAYQGDMYLAGEDNISLITLDANGNYSNNDDDWWEVARGHSRLGTEKTLSVVVEDTAYFIQKNNVHIWDGSSSQENALVLPPDFYATAAIKHPNGRDLIVFGTVKSNAARVSGAGFKVYYINTVDLEFTDEIEIDREIQGVWNVAGTLYVTTNEWLGIFTGTGVTLLKKLNLDLADSPNSDIRDALIWTHHGTVTDQGYLLVPDGSKILAVGDVGSGTIMWHVADLSDDLDVISLVFNMGGKYVGVFGYSGAKWTGTLVNTIIELDNTDGTGKWASNKQRFNQKAWVRKIALEFETLESGDDFSVGHIKQDGTEVTLHQITYAKYGAISSLEIYPNVLTDVYQYLHTWTAGGVGLKKVTIFYENGE